MIKRRDPRIVALDGMSLAHLNTLALKRKLGAEIMDTIALCAADCGRPWTDDLVRHEKAILRGAVASVLVCAQCLGAVKVDVKVDNETGTYFKGP